MKCLLIDNYDSYTHILADYLWQCCDEKPIVIKNDALSLEEAKYLEFDRIVISPGPGHPDNRADFGVCKDLIAYFRETPILGVCLGHQGIGSLFGLSVAHAPKAMHGKSTMIRHCHDPLFKGVPELFRVIRYHSLILTEDARNDQVEIIAREADEGLIMAIRIKETDIYGVQFHPESIGTEYGMRIIDNFIRLTGKKKLSPARSNVSAKNFYFDESASDHTPEYHFYKIYSKTPKAFWLDSSQTGTNGTISIMGAPTAVIESKGKHTHIHSKDANDSRVTKTISELSPFAIIQETLKSQRIHFEDFPYPFSGGLVGYFSYEAKSWLGYGENLRKSESSLPDCVMMQVDHFILFDHKKGRRFLCSISEDESAHRKFIKEVEKLLMS